MKVEKEQRFLRVKHLTRRWGVHRATIWRWVKAGDLPRPRQLGPKVFAWPIGNIKKFERRYLDGGVA